MLSSRPQHALFVDKENGAAVSSRKPAGSYVSSQAAASFKTPGVKQQPLIHKGAKTTKATSDKLALKSANANGKAATVALEPGARVLSTKDGNNRAGIQPLKAKDAKGKASEMAYEKLSLIPAQTLAPVKEQPGSLTVRSAAPSTAAKSQRSVRIEATPARDGKSRMNTKTPARTPAPPSMSIALDSIKQPPASAFKTPRPSGSRSSLSMSGGPSNPLLFKTPSPNQLSRRRKGGGSPTPLLFNPTSLRSDNDMNEDAEALPPPPTFLEQVAAGHALIDDESEVDCATRQAVDPKDIPDDPPCDMPDYKSMNLNRTLASAQWTINLSNLDGHWDDHLDFIPPPPSDDESECLCDSYYDQPFPEPPLFPLVRQANRKTAAGPPQSTQGRLAPNGHPSQRSGDKTVALPSKTMTTSRPRAPLAPGLQPSSTRSAKPPTRQTMPVKATTRPSRVTPSSLKSSQSISNHFYDPADRIEVINFELDFGDFRL